MIRNWKALTLAWMLGMSAIAGAQTYSPYQPAYYPAGVYWVPASPQTSISYYPPPDPRAAVTGNTATVPVPIRAWDGGWTYSGYSSPALPYYSNYRTPTLGFRR